MSHINEIRKLKPDEFLTLPDTWMTCKKARYSITYLKRTTKADFKTRTDNGLLYVTRVK